MARFPRVPVGIVAMLLPATVALAASAATEYFHAGYGHHFVTAMPSEIAALDAGAFSGWSRTGLSFDVLAAGEPGASNVCRFWSGRTFAPKSSHFYTAFDRECAIVKRNPDWVYEGLAFSMLLPDGAGTCAAGTVPLYRLYNNGQTGAPNHRYTTSLVVRSQMLAQGWIAEGSGIGVIGCVEDSRTWVRSFDLLQSHIDFAVQLADGDYLAVGTTSADHTWPFDAMVMKLDSTGNMLWARRYDAGVGSNFRQVVQPRDGGYLVIGALFSGYPNSPETGQVVKLDAQGEVAWSRAFAAELNGLALAADGGCVVVGRMLRPDGAQFLPDAWIAKLDAVGNVVWQKSYMAGTGVGIEDIRATPDGGFVIGGHVIPVNPGDFLGAGPFVAKINNGGEVHWQKNYGTRWGQLVSVLPTTDGGYAALVQSQDYALLLRTDLVGDILWQKTYYAGSNNAPLPFVQTSDGGYIIGFSLPSVVMKVDSLGGMLWQQRYDIPGGATNLGAVRVMLATADGGYLAQGYQLWPGRSDILRLMKFDADAAPAACVAVNASDLVLADAGNFVAAEGQLRFTGLSLPTGMSRLSVTSLTSVFVGGCPEP